MAVSLC